MNKIDAMIAPRALTAREVAEVIAPQLIAYGVAHRAFTFANLWDANDAGATSAAEAATAAILDEAERSVREWLKDVEGDGEPRFYQKSGLTRAIGELAASVAKLMCMQSDQPGVAVIISQLEDREGDFLSRLINA